MKSLTITKIKQKCVKNIYLKVERKKSAIACVLCSCFIMLFCCAVVASNNKEITSAYALVYNPVNPLYNNFNDVVFTSAQNDKTLNKNLKFLVPVKSSKFESENGELKFFIDNSIMVKSCEDGIVCGMGVLPNGEKYLEIKHSPSVVSRYSNIDITGVVINQLVKKGKDVATAKLGEYLRFSVFVDGVSQNLTVSKNLVLWGN